VLFRITNRILNWLGITRQPVIKLYDGFGDVDEILIYGHVLALSPRSPKRLRKNILLNMFGLVRLFIIKPIKNAAVELDWFGQIVKTNTDIDGHFKFEWKPHFLPEPGWHRVKASYHAPKTGLIACTAECDVFIPHVYQYGFISDIDDTFLISHSSNLYKRLKVLFTKNAASRKPFEGVVEHYCLLSRAGAADGPDNPFFFVSSSEWNLYNYITHFCKANKLPRGILLLNQMKRLSQILNTAQGKHSSKYLRIVRILKTFPHHKYILLGDNSQKDPEIYARIVEDFPDKILAVYIRNVTSRADKETVDFLKRIDTTSVLTCYFSHSADAIEHSRRIGLI
jgi:phosphatidate phosphatase APP1